MKMMPLALALAVLFALRGCGQAAGSTVQEPTSSAVTGAPAGPVLPAAPYEDLTEAQLALFEETGKVGVEDVKSYLITMDSMEQSQNDLITGCIEAGKLPANGVELFGEWKTRTEYYKQSGRDLLANNLRSESGGSLLDEPQPTPETPPATPAPGETTPPATPDKPIKTPEQVEPQKPGTNNDSGTPLTPEEMKEAIGIPVLVVTAAAPQLMLLRMPATK